jgi:hypothetical protein
MYKQIFATIFWSNKTISLAFIKPFDYTTHYFTTLICSTGGDTDGVAGCVVLLLSLELKKNLHHDVLPEQQQASASTLTVCSVLTSSFMIRLP